MHRQNHCLHSSRFFPRPWEFDNWLGIFGICQAISGILDMQKINEHFHKIPNYMIIHTIHFVWGLWTGCALKLVVHYHYQLSFDCSSRDSNNNSEMPWRHTLCLTRLNWITVNTCKLLYKCWQWKLWDLLRTRAIPERLRGEITTRLYTKPIIPLPLPLRISLVFFNVILGIVT